LQIQEVLRTEQLAAPAAVTAAFGASTRAAVGIIVELNHQIGDLEAELATHFEAHPDADIYRSLPGLGVILGARVLGEIRGRPEPLHHSQVSRKNYAGTSPLTIASGRERAVLARHVRNRRLYDAVDQWAFCALQSSPGARAFYDHHRAAGDLHHQALRAPGNRLVGILHGCLRHHTHYDEHKAWAHRQPAAAACRLRTLGCLTGSPRLGPAPTGRAPTPAWTPTTGSTCQWSSTTPTNPAVMTPNGSSFDMSAGNHRNPFEAYIDTGA
jgi:hypothetical protein